MNLYDYLVPMFDDEKLVGFISFILSQFDAFLQKCMVCLIHIRLKLYNMIRPKYLPPPHQRLKGVSVRCRSTEPWLLTVATTN